jgi:hypothetical protein
MDIYYPGKGWRWKCFPPIIFDFTLPKGYAVGRV